jgi:hypothetical protein
MSVRDLDSYKRGNRTGGANRFGMIAMRTGNWTTPALRRGETHSS